MGRLQEYFRASKVGLSFELFPPKSEELLEGLFQTVQELSALNPGFFTCTYGAGGSTRDRTLQVAAGIKQRFGFPVASHLTCVGSSVDQLRDYLRAAQSSNVDYIVALRGDPPKGESQFRMTEGGLRYANELVALIRSEFPSFDLAVAGYPEVHQEAPSYEVDLANLKRKVDAGADIVITQLFYKNEDFFRFRDRCEQFGIRVPIIPGILPVISLSQILRIASLCKASLPDAFVSRLAHQPDADWQFSVGVEFATRQVQELIEGGAVGIHFYVLNRSQAASQVLKNLQPLFS